MRQFTIVIIGLILAALLLGLTQIASAAGETTSLQSWVDATDTKITAASTSLTNAVARLAAAESAATAQAAATAVLQATVTTQAATAAALQVTVSAQAATVAALAARVATLEALAPGVIPPPPVPVVGTGLTGQYFNDSGTGAHFGKLVLMRNDATVNFTWGSGSPDPLVTVDNFSVRWTGNLLAPTTGNYTFSTLSDDGARLWVNGVQVINNWTDHYNVTDVSVPVALVAGTMYNIAAEFYEHTGGATFILSWIPPGGTAAVIPQSALFPTFPVVSAGILGTPPNPLSPRP